MAFFLSREIKALMTFLNIIKNYAFSNCLLNNQSTFELFSSIDFGISFWTY